MTLSIPLLLQSSIEIAWDYLRLSGELGDSHEASLFLSNAVRLRFEQGETRRLMLSNKAIDDYKRFKAEQRRAA